MVGAILKELERSTKPVFQFGKFNFLPALAASSDRILEKKAKKIYRPETTSMADRTR